MAGGHEQNRIWIDTDDFIRMFDWTITPTGIGRVQLELIPELLRTFPDRVRLFRVSHGDRPAIAVDPEVVARLVKGAGFVLANGRNRRALVRLVMSDGFHRQCLPASQSTWVSSPAPLDQRWLVRRL